MNQTRIFKQNNLRERRLQFMRIHQDAFDLEPIFILSLFEEAVQSIEGACGVEPTCHVEGNQLFATNYQVSHEEHTWPISLNDAVKFLNKVESRVGIKLNRDLLKQFVEVHISSHKITNNTIGIDLRPKLENSCIKIYMHLELAEDPEELVRTALALDGGSYSPELLQVLLKDTVLIGFNLFLNGHSDVELWSGSPGGQGKDFSRNRGIYLTSYIQKHFSQKVISIFEASLFLIIHFPKTKVEPSLSFHIRNIRDLKKYVLFNSLGNRIYDFIISQDCVTYAALTVKERELNSYRLENFSFSYNKRDQCQPYAG